MIALQHYPLSRIQKIWFSLAGKQKFTKLDFRDAYQQLVLQDEARKYVIIATTMVLFQFICQWLQPQSLFIG